MRTPVAGPTNNAQFLRRVARASALIVILVIVAAGLLPSLFAPFDPAAEVGPPLQAPGGVYILGTDDLGRDLLSMLISGATGTLILTVVAVGLTFLIGGLIGLVAGYVGGFVDMALSRVIEFVGILPRLLILLLVSTLIEPSLIGTAILLGLTSWPGLARLIRAETISQKHREHVIAARALGCGEWRIIFRHLSAAAIAPTIALIGPISVSAILIEASLGFLGLSDPDFVSWGDLIRNGQLFFNHGWWLAVYPGITIIAICVSLAVLTESEVSAK